MDVRRDLVISMGVMIALPLLLAVNAILLSTRMGPAIDRVIDDNVVSMRAAAEVVEVVAEAQAGPLDGAAIQRFDGAFERLEANITEDAERPPLAAMEAARAGALQGEPSAVRDEVTEALALIDINIEAMHRRNDEARRLGYANAWAAVFAGLLAFIISRIIARRLRRRVIEPVSDLWAVLRRVRGGESFPRCRHFETSSELQGVLSAVNELLDQRARTASQAPAQHSIERAALLVLLEEIDAPAAVVGDRGELLAGNERLLHLLAQADGEALRELLRRRERWPEDPRISEVRPLAPAQGSLVRLGPERSEHPEHPDGASALAG